MKIKRKEFGVLSSGRSVHLYVLKNGSMTVALSEYGAALTSLLLPDGLGGWDDVVLGYSTLSGYTENRPFFGVTVGRYANRIARGRFALGGREYELARNDGDNHLHGGRRGFDKAVWASDSWIDRRTANVKFTLRSHDGEEGYPGNLDVEVVYSLSRDDSLTISYKARSDTPTPINLTNHTYFNLKGEGSGSIGGHELRLACPRYVEVDGSLIPTGVLREAAGTPFDFAAAKPLGRDMEAAGGGYDHCFAVDRTGMPAGTEALCAVVKEPDTGRALRVWTTSPGVQLYTGNFLSQEKGKRGAVYDKHAGFCLETGFFPDSPNRPDFPDCTTGPGDVFRHSTTFEFGRRESFSP